MSLKEELNELSISELKKIAKDFNIKYEKNIKKYDLVNLILESGKITELEKRENNQSENKKNENNILELPKSYEKDRIVLMIRDPYWGFVYWNLTENLINENNLYNIDKFLRIYDITNNGSPENPDYFFDIKINNEANNWYIKFPMVNRTFVVDYGYVIDGKFKTLLRSNIAKSPRDNISDQIDEEWMLTDEKFNLIMEASGADKLFQQIGSQELIKFLAGNVNEEISSNIGNSPIYPFST